MSNMCDVRRVWTTDALLAIVRLLQGYCLYPSQPIPTLQGLGTLIWKTDKICQWVYHRHLPGLGI